mmetsp:Transcript_31211/g.50100  ORF Transcript_31211/g.50100 Transcript_31211/m.50100 type:complete len:91 (-) Transcript_31211:1815-2087(-)
MVIEKLLRMTANEVGGVAYSDGEKVVEVAIGEESAFGYGDGNMIHKYRAPFELLPRVQRVRFLKVNQRTLDRPQISQGKGSAEVRHSCPV